MKMEHCALLSMENRNFFHYILAHPKALKDSIPCSQALRIKGMSLETAKVIKYLNNLKDASIKSGYHFEILDHHFEIAMNVD